MIALVNGMSKNGDFKMSYEQGAFGGGPFASALPKSSHKPGGFVRYWEIGEHRELMGQLESFLESVLETDHVPFDIRQHYGRQQAVRNPIGVSGYRSLSGFLPLCGQWMDLYWPGWAYSADLQLFFDCFMQHPCSQVLSDSMLLSNVEKVVAANIYNDFVDCLRIESVRRGVKKWLSDWRGNVDKQGDSIRRYLATLATQYQFIVPIRVEMNYAEYAFGGSDAMARTGWAVSSTGVWMPVPSQVPLMHGRPETRARIDTSIAMAHRDDFFQNRRGADKAVFERMVGYVCKLEQGGRHRANHFHCIFLLDGRRLTQADVRTIKFGLVDRWRRVTGGQGLMFDCHERADRAQLEAQGKWAIDPVDCTNAAQVATLIEYVAGYFAKDEQLIRVKPTAKAWTLTKGR